METKSSKIQSSPEDSWLDRQRMDTQQPLSLMTVVNANATKQEDLLTIRILESSERKMQLIKKLLTPEEFNSVASNLYSSEFQTYDIDKHRQSLRETQGASIPLDLHKSKSKFHRVSKFSSSETDLNLPPEPCRQSLHEKLAKKREAIEFFLNGSKDETSSQQSALAIKLQSGNSIRINKEDEKRVLKDATFDLTDRIIGLLGMFGITWIPDRLSESTLLNDEKGGGFKSYLEGENTNLPYTRVNNLLLIRRRLEADSQLDKITFEQQPERYRPKLRRKMDIAELYQNLCTSSNLDVRSKELNCSVGFFYDKIRLIKSHLYLPFSDIKLLSYNSPLLERLVNFSYGRKKLPDTIESNSLIQVVELKLNQVKFKNHPLMIPEEKFALEIVEANQLYEKRWKKFIDLTRKLRDVAKVQDPKSELKKVVDTWKKLLIDLVETKRKILTLTNELKQLRNQQKFNSTSICIHIIEEKVNESQNPSTDLALRDVIGKFLDSQEFDQVDRMYAQVSSDAAKIKIASGGISITGDNECPLEEKERRHLLNKWFRDLQVVLLIGDKYVYKCEFDSAESFLNLQIDSKTLSIPYEHNSTLKLIVELHKRTRIYRNISFFSTVLARGKIELSTTNCSKMQDINLGFLHSNNNDISEDFEAYLRIASGRKLHDKITCCSHYIPEFIDSLYCDTFKISHPFMDKRTKLYRLMNIIDPSFILKALGIRKPKDSYFILDPFIDELKFDTKEEGLCGNSKKWSKMRLKLLVWRWVNNSRQSIYLNERENLKVFNFPVDEFKSHLRLPSMDLNLGYKLVDHIRAWASDYIKEFERELLKVLEFEQEKGNQSQDDLKLTSLLKEPKLKMVDLSGAVRVVRKMIPKRTTRRPLMPHRKASKWPTIMGQHEFFTRHPEILSTRKEDVEAQQLGQHWQRLLLASGGEVDPVGSPYTEKFMASGHHLQLVVSVQNASNVPMRIIQSQTGARSRSNSPLLGSTSSPTSFIQQQASNFLTPATSYVEIIFQRKQQATSLSQGKNPSWNETLFFPINLSSSNQQQSLNSVNDSKQQKAHLVDEFLQLNLYDYQQHSQDNNVNSGIGASPLLNYSNQDYSPTLELMPSSSNGEMFSSNLAQHSTGQRIVATNEKVERHLLGSLRIPLATLMSTGKIEGSFSLEQPLLLENYQFSLTHDMHLYSEVELKPITLEQTRISLFITLDPPISIPAHLALPIGSIENELVFEYARLWEQTVFQYRRNQKITTSSPSPSLSISMSKVHKTGISGQRRHIRALVLRRDAKYSLIIRLLYPLEPPKSLRLNNSGKDEWYKQMTLLARFVALLNPVKHGLFNIRLLATNLWFDCKQLVNMALGGSEEKAVLLCNYFSYLGKCSALLLGDSIHEGRCVYVIVWLEQTSERFLENQLQLQATSLLNSLNSSLGGPINDHLPDVLISNNNIQTSIDRYNFITRLPVVINASSIQLWNPIKGNCYTLSDQLPLVSVGSIVTPENVYANIQSLDSPTDTNYDIRQRHFWLPLFESNSTQVNSNNSLPFHSSNQNKKPEQMNWRRKRAHLEQLRRLVGRPIIERDQVNYNEFNYSSFSEQQCSQFKGIIERTIKAQLLNWRPDRPTYFNRTLSRLIAEKLALFEKYLEETNADVQRKWKSELEDLIRSEVLVAQLSSNGLYTRQVVSCPINLPYTSMKTILDTIFASGVQNADLVLDSSNSSTASTQFLVACHVHPYPARVLSIWLYVAAIIPNSQLSSYRLNPMT